MYFSFLLYDFWFQFSRGVYVKFLGGWNGLRLKIELKKDRELMWSTAVSFEVDTQDFPVSEDMLPRIRQDTDEVSLIYVEELCSIQFY